MNDTKFTSTAKAVSNGSKIKYVVFADGVEIGSRTAGRSYKFAVVARSNHAHSLAIAKGSLAHGISELAKYEGYLSNPQASLAAEKIAFHRDNLAKWLNDGTVAGWIANLKKQVPQAETYLALRLSQTQDSPDFQKWSVVAFSNTGKDAQRDWMFGMRFIPLTQPEAA